ncbi:hypothetical protein BX616_009432 [Lobosporangium transversale]|uniref:Uncharacterized protein n=1 Tax=Lobosporangium transversale TaxID=64571 RepID=A0A1Y2GK34_9FUNG|nr:hypothetical protein BCR41DRAFT_423070 [Lobosporangium transversale]KAF9913861.1 hypothetical protein BX616_009432 [Lobosporangium transversale]ORZ13007.1 hypothetical protein BCR41DRAFT_423070 [Lobosporangium transversale]|eukprot:XP_021880356.1 hypothetical protein BCR41DRAFT_423070 [Lobosporangium transversale]
MISEGTTILPMQPFMAVSLVDHSLISGTVTRIQVRVDAKTSEYIILPEDITNAFKEFEYLVVGSSVISQMDLFISQKIKYQPGIIIKVAIRRADDVSNPPAPISRALDNLVLKAHQKQQSEVKTPEQTKNQSLLDHIHVLQEQVLQIRQVMEDKQQDILMMQIQAHALITQTYEFRECPIPRLFIVLPRPTGLLERRRWPSEKQFRLFYLCECSGHLITSGGRVPCHIHLVKHEGYDIDRPAEFFEKYGAYVLTILLIFKHGIFTADAIVPPLAKVDISEWLEAVQDVLKLPTGGIVPLVDESISYIKKIQQNSGRALHSTMSEIKFEGLKYHNGIDSRQLESFLRVNRAVRALGNMYRIVTSEGHVKWVCADHYHGKGKETASRQLMKVISNNDGGYNAQLGSVRITIRSAEETNRFYKIIAKEKDIQELDITFACSLTTYGFYELLKAVAASKITRLAVDWDYTKGEDGISRLTIYAVATAVATIFGIPIGLTICGLIISVLVELVYDIVFWKTLLGPRNSENIQILYINHPPRLFTDLLHSSLLRGPKLRSLILTDCDFRDAYDETNLEGLLAYYPALVELRIGKLRPGTTLEYLLGGNLPMLQTLETLQLEYGDSTILQTKYSKGKILESKLEIVEINVKTVTYHSAIIYGGQLTGLVVNKWIQPHEWTTLEAIISNNPRISCITCDSKPELK